MNVSNIDWLSIRNRLFMIKLLKNFSNKQFFVIHLFFLQLLNGCRNSEIACLKICNQSDYIDQVRTQAFNYQQMLFQQLTDRYTRWYEDESINKLGKPIVDFLWLSAVCMTCRCDIALDLIMLNF